MLFSGAMLVVKDVRTSKEFYETLLEAQVFLDLDDYVSFKDKFALLGESTWLEYIEKGQSELCYRNHTVELFFEEDDLDAFMEKLAFFKDVPVLNPVKQYPWGQRVVRFYDPDGHVVEVGENMRVVVTRFLDSGMTDEEAAEKSMFPLSFVRECREAMHKKK